MSFYSRAYEQCRAEVDFGERKWTVTVEASAEDWDDYDYLDEKARPLEFLVDAEAAGRAATGSNVTAKGQVSKDGGTITIRWRDASSHGPPPRLRGGVR